MKLKQGEINLIQIDTNVLVRDHAHAKGTGQNVLTHVHGFGCNQTMWDAVTPVFATTHKQVLFDYGGGGHSDIYAFDATAIHAWTAMHYKNEIN